jgi:hypothetical protein
MSLSDPLVVLRRQQLALSRLVEMIGEAASRVPADLQSRHELPVQTAGSAGLMPDTRSPRLK